MPTRSSAAQAGLNILRHQEEDDSAAALRTLPMPRRNWFTRLALPLGLLTAAGGALAFAARDALLPARVVHVVPVIQRTGIAGGGGTVVQAPGWVEAEPYAVAVSALADGIVREILVLEGQPVAAGQVVARLVDDDARLALQRAEAAVAAHQAALATAQAAQHAAQRNWDHPIERVRQLAIAEARLAETHAELERWPAEVAAAAARSAELEAEHERIARLHQQGAAGEIERIRAEQQHLAQAAAVRLTRGREAVLQAQAAAYAAEIQAARENLRLRIEEHLALETATASVAQAHAALAEAAAAREEARLRLARMEVVSPVDGIVMTRLVEPGSKVMLSADMPSGAQLLRVYDPARLQVRVDIPLADAAKVSVGQEAEVVVNILPDQTFHGRVTRIVPEADIQRNTLQVKVALTDPSVELRPEMLAKARFLAPPTLDEPNIARVFAPERLLRPEAAGTATVWLADTVTGRAQRRSIALGTARAEGWVEVRDGLKPGDRLIVDPTADLRPGTRIRIEAEITERSSAHQSGPGDGPRAAAATAAWRAPSGLHPEVAHGTD